LSESGHLLPVLYAQDRQSGWSNGMRAITHTLLGQMTLPPQPIVEIGAGSGLFWQELQGRYPDRVVVGTDLHPLALAYAQTLRPEQPPLLRVDLHRLPLPPASIGTLIALDAFDQQGVDLPAALAESWRVLVHRGMLLLRVSAHPWLDGAHDRAFNTGRRFTQAELLTALQAARFAVRRSTYANSLLAPLIVPLRLLQRWGWLEMDENLDKGQLTNQLLAEALQIEARWLGQTNFPFGISLYLIAQKHD